MSGRLTACFAGKTRSRDAVEKLKRYEFPGNVRELENIIERATYRDTGGDITPEDLGLVTAAEVPSRGGSFQERVDAFRKRLLVAAVAEAKNNQAEADRILGLSYHKFRYFYKFVGRDTNPKRKQGPLPRALSDTSG